MKNNCILIILFIMIFYPVTVKAEERLVTDFSRCIDGDTAELILNNDKIKVRFLAIDTPEISGVKEPYGDEASDFTCGKLKSAKKIELEFDINSSKLDKYDRYLAWVFVDNQLLQKLLINNGLVEVKYLYGDYKYTNILKEEQLLAQNNNLGIWNNNKDGQANDYYIYFILILIFVGIIDYKKFKLKKRKFKSLF